MKILVVDQSRESRRQLGNIIVEVGNSVIEAENDAEAIELYVSTKPDMIFVEAELASGRGYHAAKEIKNMCEQGEFVPIIFVIDKRDGKAARHAVEYGGDDFIFLPLDADIISAKIRAMNRIRVLHSRALYSTRELSKLNQRMQRELEVSKHVLTAILEHDQGRQLPIRSWITPVSLFSGDMVLSAQPPSGGMHVMVGDFTGHGLSAALGAIPTSDIFYSMTSKGFSIGDIVVEMNKRLRLLLPPDMFCAAVLMEIDQQRTTLSVWNGGMPDVIIFRRGEGVVRSIASFNPPLGVASQERFRRKVETVPIEGDIGAFILSDGLINLMDSTGKRYQLSRLLQVIEKNKKEQDIYKSVIEDVESYGKGLERKDDISFVEVLGDASRLIAENQRGKQRTQHIKPATWCAELYLDCDALRHVNPIPHLLNLIMQIQDPAGHRERVFTVLSELFTNSLEHGLLRLDSSLKRSSQGFAEYYKMKKERLEGLAVGSIKISLTHTALPNCGILEINLQDTGIGFDSANVISNLAGNKNKSGRGIGLVGSLCKTLEYSDKGRKVRAVYQWEYVEESNNNTSASYERRKSG